VKIKTILGFLLTQSEWQSSRKQTTINSDDNVGEKDHAYIVV
jgi:hypothetical protein